MLTNLARARVFVAVCGRSGTGKTTLIDELLKHGCVERPASFTTRARRPGEGNSEYTFVTEDGFKALINSPKIPYFDRFRGFHYAMDHTTVAAIHSRDLVPIKEIAPGNILKLASTGVIPIVIKVVRDNAHRDDRFEELEEPDATIPQSQFLVIEVDLNATQASDAAKLICQWLSMLDVFALAFGPSALTQHLISADLRNRSGYDLIAPFFDDKNRITTRYFHKISEPFWSKAIPGLRGTILEIGPGNGWLRSTFNWPDVEYIGVDISEAMVTLNSDKGKILISPTSAIELPAESCSAVIGSLIDPCLTPNSLAEVLRVLVKGGKFIGTAPAGEWATALRDVDFKRDVTTVFRQKELNAEVMSFCFAIPELTDLFSAAGFRSTIAEPILRNSEEAKGAPPDVRTVLDRLSYEVPIIATWICEK